MNPFVRPHLEYASSVWSAPLPPPEIADWQARKSAEESSAICKELLDYMDERVMTNMQKFDIDSDVKPLHAPNLMQKLRLLNIFFSI